MNMWLVTLSCVVCIGNVVAQTYPSTFPIENEAIVPPAWVAEVPSSSFDDADPGGYVDYFGYKLTFHGGTLTEDNFPYTSWLNGFAMWLYVVQFEIPPLDDPELFNCTANLEARFDDADFTGLVAGERVCEVGSCCQSQIGMSMFSDDTAAFEAWFNDRISGSRCETPMEVVYCHFISGDTHSCCYEYYPSMLVRPVNFQCYDVLYNHLLSCGVFVVEYPVAFKKEPPQYYERLSNEQTMSHDSMQQLADRICSPYSYFAPASVTSMDDNSDNSSTDNSSTSSESEASSPASTIFSILTVVVLSATL